MSVIGQIDGRRIEVEYSASILVRLPKRCEFVRTKRTIVRAKARHCYEPIRRPTGFLIRYTNSGRNGGAHVGRRRASTARRFSRGPDLEWILLLRFFWCCWAALSFSISRRLSCRTCRVPDERGFFRRGCALVVEVLSVNEYGQSGVRQNTKRLAAQKEPGKAPAPVRPHHNEIAIARLGFLHDPFRCKLILNVERFAGYADALSLFCHACKNAFRIRRCGLLVFLGLI